MKSDYYRYMAEFTSGEPKKVNAEHAYKGYLQAVEIAKKEKFTNGKMRSTCSPIHPTRLGLMLNLSIFIFEILQNRAKAYETANDALEEAMTFLESPEAFDNEYKHIYKDSSL